MRNPIVVNGNNVKRFVNLVDKLPEHLRQDYTSTQVLDTFAMYLNDAYREDFYRNQYQLKKMAFNESDVYNISEEFTAFREKLLYAISTNTDVIFVQDSSINNYSFLSKYLDISVEITSSNSFIVKNVDTDFLQIGYYVSGGSNRAFVGGFAKIISVKTLSFNTYEVHLDEAFDVDFLTSIGDSNHVRIGDELSVTSDVYAFNVSHVTDVKVRRIIGESSYAEVSLEFGVYNIRNNVSDVDFRYEPRDNFLKSVIQSSNFIFDDLPKDSNDVAMLGNNFIFGDLTDKIIEINSTDYSDAYSIDDENRYSFERYNNFNFTVNGSSLLIEMPKLEYQNGSLKVVSDNNALLSAIIVGMKVVYENELYTISQFNPLTKIISFDGYSEIQIKDENSTLLLDIIDIFSQDLNYFVGDNKITISRISYKSIDNVEYFTINRNCANISLNLSSVLINQLNIGQPLYGVTKYKVSNLNYSKVPNSINTYYDGDISVDEGILSVPAFKYFSWAFESYDIFIAKMTGDLLGKQMIFTFLAGKSTEVLPLTSETTIFQYMDNKWSNVGVVKKNIWLEDSNELNRNYTIYGWQSSSYSGITLNLELTVNCIVPSNEQSSVYINSNLINQFTSNGKQFHTQVILSCIDTFEQNIPLTITSVSETNVNPLISNGALFYFRNNYSPDFDNAYRYISKDSYKYLAIPRIYEVGSIVFDGDGFYELVTHQSSPNDLPPNSLNWRGTSSKIISSTRKVNPDIFVLKNLSQSVGYVDNLNIRCSKYGIDSLTSSTIYSCKGNLLSTLSKYSWSMRLNSYDSVVVIPTKVTYISSLDLTTMVLEVDGTVDTISVETSFDIYPLNIDYSTSISTTKTKKYSKNVSEKDWVLSPTQITPNQNNRSGYIQFVDQEDISITEWKMMSTIEFYSRYDMFNRSTDALTTFDGSDIVDAYYKYNIIEISDVTKYYNKAIDFTYNMPHMNSVTMVGNYGWLYVGVKCKFDSIEYTITKIDVNSNSYTIFFDKDIINTTGIIQINTVSGTNIFRCPTQIAESQLLYSPSIGIIPIDVLRSEYDSIEGEYIHYTSQSFADSNPHYSYVFNKLNEFDLPTLTSFKIKSVYIECQETPETLQYGISSFEDDAIHYTLAQVGNGLILNAYGDFKNIIDYNLALPYLSEYESEFVTGYSYDSRYDSDTSVQAIPGIKPKYGTLLDKINGLTSMHDINSIDFNVIQYLARFMGYDLAISLPTEVHPSKNPEKMLRSVISRMPEFASLRSTSNGIESIIASFGIVTKLINLWTHKENPYISEWVSKDEIIAELKYDELKKSYIPTPHFKITVEQNSTGVYGKEFDELMNQIKVTVRKNMPVNTVFDGLIAQVKVVTRLFMKQGFVNVKQSVRVNPRPIDYKVDILDYTDCNCEC